MNIFPGIASLSTDLTSAAAASGIVGFTGIVTILLIIYGLISFFVPIFIYRIMRRTTQSYLRLGEIRDLLRRQAFLSNQLRVEQRNSGVSALDISGTDAVAEHEKALSTID
jgi:hypothetical protein